MTDERKHVVVGVRGDDHSILALQWAARTASARETTLEALIAWDLPEPPQHMPRELRETTQGLLDELRWAVEAIIDRSGISGLPGVKISTTVVAAPAKVALLAATERADLLVLGASRHSPSHAATSVGRRTAAVARCPVALVRAGQADNPPAVGDRLVVGMDGSAGSVSALEWACAEGVRRALPIQVVAVGLDSSASAAVEDAISLARQAQPGVAVTQHSMGGDPAEVLDAESIGAEALVLGQHGSGWITRQLPSLGSVSRWCAAHPVCPVVIVPV